MVSATSHLQTRWIVSTAELDCSTCSMGDCRGFRVDVIPFLVPPHLEEFAQVTPNGVGATAAGGLSVSADVSGSISKDVEPVTFSPPGGFEMPGIATFAPTLHHGI